MKKIDLSIIIVNYNTLDLTASCIKSILKHSNLNFEIIIINNYPQSKDPKKLKNKYKDSRIIIMESPNHGFGAANNLGVEYARGKYILFLNSDTLVKNNSLEKMVTFLGRHPEVGALNPLLFHPNGTRQKNYFGDFQTLSSVILRRSSNRLKKNKKFFYCQKITGAALMLRKNLFESIGGFDQKFFMYFEDEDLCRRIINSGKKNAIMTTAKIIHLEGKSSSTYNKKKMYYQSQDYYWRKHKGLFLEMVMRTLRFPYLIWQKLKNKNI